MQDKIGIMIIGANGCIGCALTVGLSLFKNQNDLISQGMITAIPPATRIPLINLNQFVLGGWDFPIKSISSSCHKFSIFESFHTLQQLDSVDLPPVFPPIIRSGDFLHNVLKTPITPGSTKDHILKVQKDIKAFKSEHNLSEVIVVNLSSPSKYVDTKKLNADCNNFESIIEYDPSLISSGIIYSIASLLESCPFLDFTPSEILEVNAILQYAVDNTIPIAGRDGSTGQTLIKSVLSHMFESRNLNLLSWYSTNILGNNDGFVLSKDEYSRWKMHDKLSVLNDAQGGSPIDHIVDIKYSPIKGDRKESWDSVEFQGWLGERMTIKINWNGKDSVLASPLILDLARLLYFCKCNNLGGIQTQLSLFFKNPIGAEDKKYFNNYRKFIKFCEDYS